MTTPTELMLEGLATAWSWFAGFWGWLIKMLRRASPRNLIREIMVKFDVEHAKIEDLNEFGFKRRLTTFRFKSEFQKKKQTTLLDEKTPDTLDDNHHDGSS